MVKWERCLGEAVIFFWCVNSVILLKIKKYNKLNKWSDYYLVCFIVNKLLKKHEIC